MNRDYSSISPSAKSLLLMKALTTIPFMRAAAGLLWGEPSLSWMEGRADRGEHLRRLIHFEERYRSVDALLTALDAKQILEISSGFSFRGLNMALWNDEVNYVDTDLAEVIDMKQQITQQLIEDGKLQLKGRLSTQALNALDEAAFDLAAMQFAAGPITIVNEGLLMYLNTAEKRSLCQIIRRLLKQRGGCWITADIYIKKENYNLKNTAMSEFLAQHNVEENKFESFEQAESFFNEQGLQILRKAEPVYDELSALKYLRVDQIEKWQQALKNRNFRIRETWVIVTAD